MESKKSQRIIDETVKEVTGGVQIREDDRPVAYVNCPYCDERMEFVKLHAHRIVNHPDEYLKNMEKTKFTKI